ncbi:MAG: UDP-N-acetylmuramoyl-L-alanine--D-glutamate ligase [Gammaproteobacteria bacterium]|nr:MAG: UDP-N-acetylmuramoyl-L-alanine--D-glutamate ligase [Gammaproteobacteria bacterium]
MAQNKPYYLVVGLGKTGVSCVNFLRARNIAVKVTDSRLSPPELDSVRGLVSDENISLGGFDYSLIAGASKVIVSPGIAMNDPFVQKAIDCGKEVVGDIQVFSDHRQNPMVGITGANAKSTVCSLVRDMLVSAGKITALGGNIGVPALDLLGSEADEADVFVLELSSFQLETVRDLPLQVGSILNISPDHMDRYESLADYVKAKQNIYKNARTLVVNREDRATYPEVLTDEQTLISFGMDAPESNHFGIREIDGARYFVHGQKSLLAVNDAKLRGAHNYSNILAAFCICEGIGVDLDKASDAVKEFAGLPHRCEWVGCFDRVDWINDSKGTNVGATLAAIEGFQSETSGEIHLILGGVAKGADFSPLADALSDQIGSIFLYGEDALAIQSCLDQREKGSVSCVQVQSLSEAVNRAKQVALEGDLVLFSPACASFDMFDDFEHRGNAFKQWVNELQGGTLNE